MDARCVQWLSSWFSRQRWPWRWRRGGRRRECLASLGRERPSWVCLGAELWWSPHPCGNRRAQCWPRWIWDSLRGSWSPGLSPRTRRPPPPVPPPGPHSSSGPLARHRPLRLTSEMSRRPGYDVPLPALPVPASQPHSPTDQGLVISQGAATQPWAFALEGSRPCPLGLLVKWQSLHPPDRLPVPCRSGSGNSWSLESYPL